MIQHIEIPTFNDDRGTLSSIEFLELPFTPKRIFYTYGSEKSTVRAGHAHKKTTVALVAMSGSFKITCSKEGNGTLILTLNNPKNCMVINTGTFHTIKCLEKDSILMVLASEPFDANDIE